MTRPWKGNQSIVSAGYGSDALEKMLQEIVKYSKTGQVCVPCVGGTYQSGYIAAMRDVQEFIERRYAYEETESDEG